MDYTHTGIDKKLVKKKNIKMKLIKFLFEVYNADRTKNRDVTRVVPLEVAVMDLNSIDIFLEHDWLVKHNSEVN